MKYEKLHLIYFSPTYTSAQIAFAITEEMEKGMEIRLMSEWDITCEVPDVEVHLGNELTIVAAPVYGGRLPQIVVERLRMFKANQAPVVPVVVYGNRDYEDALLELCDLLLEQGFLPVAGGAFIGEHSYSRSDMPVAAGRPDEKDLQAAHDFGKEILRKLEGCRLEKLPELKVKGNYPYKENRPSTPQTPVTDASLCTECEYCVGICPTEAITLSGDGAVSDVALCIKCCACVKDCPEGARTFNTPYTEMLFRNFSQRREPEVFL